MLTASAHSPVTAALSSPSRRKLGYSATRPARHSAAVHCTPLLTQQPVISVKCSSGHTGCCLKPLKDRSLPLGQPSPLTGLQSCVVALALPPAPPLPVSSPARSLSCTPSVRSGVAGLALSLSYWLRHHLLGEALLPTTAAPEPGRASENSPQSSSLGKGAHAQSDLRRPLCAGATGRRSFLV